jgi:CRP/FNR family transcriptional regulator, cyclic AMP receptor protein
MSQAGAEFAIRSADAEVRAGRPASGRRTRHQTVTALRGIPMFANFSQKHLEHLAKEADELVFDTGATIVEEGMLGETLFVVLAGKAKVVRGGRKIAEILPGEFFGELSTLDGGPRTATVVAETPMRVLRLFRRTLVNLLKDEPALTLDILLVIVRRIREIDRRIQ